jgi:hypothetical protein
MCPDTVFRSLIYFCLNAAGKPLPIYQIYQMSLMVSAVITTRFLRTFLVESMWDQVTAAGIGCSTRS